VRTWPGSPYPLGAHWDGDGVNVAVHTTAEAVELCLLSGGGAGAGGGDGEVREERVPLTERTGAVWHGYLPGVGPGQRYGLRASGPYAPGRGARFNPAKLLVDPYARALTGELREHPSLSGDDPGDSAPYVPHGVVVDAAFPWGDDLPPRTPWDTTVLYELHVKGFTARHPDVPPALRGTYAGLACPAVVQHLVGLGVTAVELLPVQHSVSERHLLRRGLVNYWGYNTLGYFAPHAPYAAAGSSGGQVAEFRAMVRTLHRAGLEVILDVVYNHTAEGDTAGPTLAFRGLDNAGYYRLDEADPSRYRDYTGCGNTLDVRRPHVLRLILDSLRYWVTEMHVDGFRFDLAVALTRGDEAVDPHAPLLAAIGQDPVLAGVKLIAEPWDLGPGGYRVGGFPAPWAEWNGRYRDTVRGFWLGQDGPGRRAAFGDLGRRLAGSSDAFAASGRTPAASINFVTAHDGFPLADLVSYARKHNEANGEGNRDGSDSEHAANAGVEGPTDDPAVLAVRRRRRRALLATLLLSTGTPMLLAGDELGRTQRGNNNAYCQDGALSWLDWTGTGTCTAADPAGDDPLLLPMVRLLLALRARSPVLRQQAFFGGRGAGSDDLTWWRTDGREMTAADWEAPAAPALVALLSGSALRTRGPRGEPLVDASYAFGLNAGAADVPLSLPQVEGCPSYRHTAYSVVLDTAAETLAPPPAPPAVLHAQSVLLLRVSDRPDGGR